MDPATRRFYREALENDEHQSLLVEVSSQGMRRGLSKREAARLLAEEWERFALENFADDSAHVDFAACAVRFINEHWIEGESSAFETAVQTTVGIGVGLFQLAVRGVVILLVMWVVWVGCLGWVLDAGELVASRRLDGASPATLGLVSRCDMELFHLVVLVAAALCGLVAGFLFGFAVVAMPGLEKLSDREFIRAFQVMDRVIQDRQPLFMLVWVGSVVALLAALAMGFQQPDGFTRGLLMAAAALYLFGVQLPTARVHIPLNNEIQTVDVEAIGEAEQKQARERFEARWNRSNRIRTAIAVVTMLLLLVVLMRLSTT